MMIPFLPNRVPDRGAAAARLLGLLLVASALAGCRSAPEVLMPTPILYHEGAVDPFRHLSDEERTPSVALFYATAREPGVSADDSFYGNDPSETVRLGRAVVAIGEEGATWDDVHAASTAPERLEPVPLRLESAMEMAMLDPIIAAERGSLPASLREFVEAVNDRIDASRDRELLVYVHGTKVSFYRSCVRAAELLHFAGRDLVGVLFDWPSHQNILAYLDGEDKERARRAAAPLESLLVFLGEHTTAERIHVLCYSAGGLVTSHALARLRRAFPDWDSDRLQEHFRIGTVIFMAADLSIRDFLHEVPDIHDLADRVVVTMSDADTVLETATVWMEHGGRIGMEGAWDTEEARDTARRLHRLELLDLSLAKEERGFDIGGHHYWYRHPWTSSDIILNVRTGLPADRRGLTPGVKERVWYLPPDYPERALEAVRRELSGEW